MVSHYEPPPEESPSTVPGDGAGAAPALSRSARLEAILAQIDTTPAEVAAALAPHLMPAMVQAVRQVVGELGPQMQGMVRHHVDQATASLAEHSNGAAPAAPAASPQNAMLVELIKSLFGTGQPAAGGIPDFSPMVKLMESLASMENALVSRREVVEDRGFRKALEIVQTAHRSGGDVTRLHIPEPVGELDRIRSAAGVTHPPTTQTSG